MEGGGVNVDVIANYGYGSVVIKQHNSLIAVKFRLPLSEANKFNKRQTVTHVYVGGLLCVTHVLVNYYVNNSSSNDI